MTSLIGNLIKIAVYTGDFSRQEKKNIRKTIREVKPKTREEQMREQLVGRARTPGQLARHSAIGALGGIGAGSLGSLIQRDVSILPRGINLAERRRAILHPRRLASGAAIGSIYGALVPAVQRLADIESAKRGMY